MDCVRNVLVTGATGFIGRPLVAALVEKGARCRCLVRDETRARSFLGNSDRLELWKGAVEDGDSLSGIGDGMDVVIHLAALLGSWNISEARMNAVNVEGTRNVLDATRSVGLFLHCSTPGVQGLGHERAKEEAPFRPRGLYERSKAAAEGLVRRSCDTHRRGWIIVRPDFVYGPGDVRRVPLYRRVERGTMVLIRGGKARITPTLVNDVVNGLERCLDVSAARGQVFNLSGPQVTFRQFLQAVARELGVRPPRIDLPELLARSVGVSAELVYGRGLRREPPISRSRVDFLARDHGTDATKAARTLNLPDPLALDEGMRRTIAWCRQEGHLRG